MNIFYLVAGFGTGIVFLLGYLLWVKTRSVGFVFGAMALYFWSIHGAWGLTYDKTVGSNNFRYHYLEEALFAVELDESYVAAILIYTIFCLAVLTAALLLVRGRKPAISQSQRPEIKISHMLLLLFGIGSAIASYYLIADVFLEAVILGQTGYTAIGAESIQFFTIHQVLNRAALFSLLIGFSIFVSGSNNRFFRSTRRISIGIAYLLSVAAVVGYMVVLGNKNELLTGFVFAGLFYIGTHSRAPVRKVVGIGLVLFLLVASVDYLRNFALLSGESAEIEASELLEQTGRVVFSNEAFAAHFSMYGAVRSDIQPTYGTGLYALVFSFIPINIWPDRPTGNYSYYAEAVGAASGRGYTIHHATSWYLDFGIAGVVAGGVLLGGIWAWLHNGFVRTVPGPFSIRRLFFIVASFGFAAYIPVIIRAGVEVYKGAFLGAIAVPMLFLIFATALVQSGRRGEVINDARSAA